MGFRPSLLGARGNMATKKAPKKKIEETIIDQSTEQPIEQAGNEIPEEVLPNLEYEVTVIGTVEHAIKDTDKVKEIVETPVEAPQEKKYTVKTLRENQFFAVDENGKYVLLNRTGKYKTVKVGDIISL